MNQIIFNFLVIILFLIGVVFGAHLLLLNYLEYPLFNDKIILAYIVNTLFAILVFILLFSLREKFKNQIGFLFIFGSIIKVALFLILFYGSYKLDDFVSKSEFFAFFTPYFFTLVIEIFSLSKWLNKIE